MISPTVFYLVITGFIGAFKAYSATNLVCTILASVLAVCALVFDIGFLPSLTVCLVWIVNLSVYCKEAMRYSKAGNKIS